MSKLQKRLIKATKTGRAEIIRDEFEDGKSCTNVWWFDNRPVQTISEKTFQGIKSSISKYLEYTETTYSNWKNNV